jgi:segregation and condensation protein B
MNAAAAVECLLFVAGEPLPLQEIARALKCDDLEAEGALRELQLRLGAGGSGLQVVSIAGGWQLATRPEYAETIAVLLARGESKLSRAALETLAIVAYRQPVTQSEIEAVRGVSCGGVIKTLLERRLIYDAGRKQSLGRPILYATTPEFLHYFAIGDIAELPPLDEDERERLPTAFGVTSEVELDAPAPIELDHAH